MIPQKLELKNFLSYGPEVQTINFKNYNLICLSGKNGHGKSAILDAITWAIWGQARKTTGNAKADEGLVYLGQKHMFILFEFEINNRAYRIRREYVKTKSKPFTSLDFGLIQEDGKVNSLTAKTIKTTQAIIEKTVGITYDSFISSAFLRQGQSNEFSKKSPSERKEILAEILQLQQFDQQKKIALQQLKKNQQKFKISESIHLRIESEIKELTESKKLQKQIENSIKDLKKSKKEILSKVSTAEEKKENLSKKIQLLNFLKNQEKELLKLLKNQKQNERSLLKNIEINNSINDKKKIEKLKKDETILQKNLTEAQENQKKRLELRERYLKHKEALIDLLSKHEKKVIKDKQNSEININKLDEQLSNQTLQLKEKNNLITKLKQEIKDLSIEIKDYENSAKNDLKSIKQQKIDEDEFNKLKLNYQKLCAEGAFLQIKLTEIINKINNLSETKKCSLCSQKTDAEAIKAIQTELNKEKNQLKEKINSLKLESIKIRTELSNSHTKIQTFKLSSEKSLTLLAQLDQKKIFSKKLNLELDEQLKSTILITKKIEYTEKEKNAELVNLKRAKKAFEEIENIDECKEIKAELDKIEQAGKKLKYDPNQHAKIKTELDKLHLIFKSNENAKESEEKLSEHKAELSSLQKSIKLNESKNLEIISKIKKGSKLEIEKNKLEKIEQDLRSKINRIENENCSLLLKKGALDQKINKQKILNEELISIDKDLKNLKIEISDYQEIAKALGKEGIQALLIEQAIPEIEHETNEILSRLTNNQTQIFIESLRDLKKGGNKETLDIKISDSFGLRNYEMFSGGEAFRIDFALRIGISKLLSKKIGTTMQTIFIDEGFGSQDEEGLQLVMENIYKIQDEFSKIIIVSHLPELKDNFPVQFLVEKKRSGSTVSVIEQG